LGRIVKKKLIAGNWKMNGVLSSNEALLKQLLAGLGAPACEVAVCVPSVYLAQAQTLISGSALTLGAQDISANENGAFTGEISPLMLKDFGVR
jgi:triosephosphate isomerase